MNVRRVVLTASAAVLGLGMLGVSTLAGAASANGRPLGDARPTASATCPTGTGTGTPAGVGRGGAGSGTTAGVGRGGTGTGTPVGAGRGAAGTGPAATADASGTLTAAQEADLAFMIEEEKLAHDVYTALAATYDVRVFSRIAAAETQHLTTMRALAATYGVDDPSSDVVGEFADAGLAAMYTELVAQGSASLTEAYAVGQAVERDDLARLAEAGTGLSAPDLEHAYTRLTSASEQHLAAFGG
ncbi:MAG: DUF2202 domain-containing protein [Actinobacteria bacterium]|nr:DUF2202 domain-containing protein [Actinomycetota bacterium]MCG2802323.1 DUF2202 domain-containing protein [Cellulomonas sp.]